MLIISVCHLLTQPTTLPPTLCSSEEIVPVPSTATVLEPEHEVNLSVSVQVGDTYSLQ